MTWKIPLADLEYGAEEEEAVLAVLRRRWLTMGEETERLEAEFADFVGARHAIAVTNGTAALHLAGLALGWGPGDEVIVPSLTFVATANAVGYSGATPVFAEVSSERDFSIDPDDVAARITERTRAISIVHYGGYACDMPRLAQLARENELAIVEDAAHAPGAALDGRSLGTWGDIGCFSFFSNKNMATGEGGMLVTDDGALAERLRLLRSHGMTTLTWDRHQGHAFSYDVSAQGYNYRIDEVRAALGRVQLKKLPEHNERRRALNDTYVDALTEFAPELTIPYREHRGRSSHHIRPVLLPDGVDRHRFMAAMKEQGIQTSIHYPPVHQFSHYRDGTDGQPLPLTEEIARREVTLPLYASLDPDDVIAVARAARAALAAASGG